MILGDNAMPGVCDNKDRCSRNELLITKRQSNLLNRFERNWVFSLRKGAPDVLRELPGCVNNSKVEFVHGIFGEILDKEEGYNNKGECQPC
jgi:hypothetical protein